MHVPCSYVAWLVFKQVEQKGLTMSEKIITRVMVFSFVLMTNSGH